MVRPALVRVALLLLLLLSAVFSNAWAQELAMPVMQPAVPEGIPTTLDGALPTTGTVVGGDDLRIAVGDFSYTIPEFCNMAVAPDGDLYAVVRHDGAGAGVDVWRSQDGGTSWTQWGQINDAAGNNARYPDISIAYGSPNRVFVTYSDAGQIIVAYADPADFFASWTQVVAIPNTFGSAFDPTLINDAVLFPSGYFLYVAGVAVGSGHQIVFARSTNQGTSWETAYVVGPNTSGGTTNNFVPRLELGVGTSIHLSWEEGPVDLTSASIAVRYRRALNFAGSGIASWDPVTNITETTDARWSGRPLLSASTSSNMLVLAHREGTMSGSTPVFDRTVIRVSTDGGVTWELPDDTTFLSNFLDDIQEVPGSDSWVGVGIDGTGPFAFHLYRGAGNPTLTWNSPEHMGDFVLPPTPMGADLILDPTRGNRGAVLQGIIEFPTTGVQDELWFDAEWRGDPGYPVTEPGFPVGDEAQGAPILADFEGDDLFEVIYPSRDATDSRIEAFHPDGTAVAGWPVVTPQLTFNGTVVAGSRLPAGGPPAIFAGTSAGAVVGYDASGSPLPGFPVALDSGKPTVVSMAAINRSARQIVAVGGPWVDLISWDGSRAPAPFFVIDDLVGPAAIGDVGNDGDVEVVVAEDDWIYVLSPKVFDDPSTLPDLSHNLVGETITVAPILTDLDLDGDLEIVVGTLDGDVYAIHHDGTTVTGWPWSDPGGLQVTALASAQVRGTSEPEVVVGTQSGFSGFGEMHLLTSQGVSFSGFPTDYGSYLHTPRAISVDVIEGSSPDLLLGALGLYAVDNFGVNIPGWPRLESEFETRHPPACGDIDGDGNLELAWATEDLRVFDLGVPVTGQGNFRWPMAGYDAQHRRCFQCIDDAATAVGDPIIRTTLSFLAPTPNPSSGLVSFRYELPEESRVELSIFDARGRLIRTMVAASEVAGEKSVAFNGRDSRDKLLASGQYFARLTVSGPGGEHSFTRKFVLMR